MQNMYKSSILRLTAWRPHRTPTNLHGMDLEVARSDEQAIHLRRN